MSMIGLSKSFDKSDKDYCKYAQTNMKLLQNRILAQQGLKNYRIKADHWTNFLWVLTIFATSQKKRNVQMEAMRYLAQDETFLYIYWFLVSGRRKTSW